jgi:hypothetical protein
MRERVVLISTRGMRGYSPIQCLYNALVRVKLEYNALVWNPPEECYILMAKKVQKAFRRSLFKKSMGTTPSCSLLDSSWAY